MDLKKVEAIISWQDLENVIGLRLFLGFCNYYKRFINRQSDKIELFTRITKKDKLWKWDDGKMRLFKEIKQEFIRELILKIYQLKLLIRVEIDVLDFILGACLLQKYNGV